MPSSPPQTFVRPGAMALRGRPGRTGTRRVPRSVRDHLPRWPSPILASRRDARGGWMVSHTSRLHWARASTCCRARLARPSLRVTAVSARPRRNERRVDLPATGLVNNPRQRDPSVARPCDDHAATFFDAAWLANIVDDRRHGIDEALDALENDERWEPGSSRQCTCRVDGCS